MRNVSVGAKPSVIGTGRPLPLGRNDDSVSCPVADLGSSAAMIVFPELRARPRQDFAPAWVQASLFDDAAARLLVSRTGELLWASRRVDDVISRSACFRIDRDRLTGLTRRLQAKLDELLGEAGECGTMVEGLFAPDEDERPVLFVSARRSEGPDGGSLLLVLREIGRETIQMPDLVRLFGLTQAENQVVCMLLNGMSVANIARRQHNSELTVRTHLKRSYSKMSIRTKEQLFAKMLRLMTD